MPMLTRTKEKKQWVSPTLSQSKTSEFTSKKTTPKKPVSGSKESGFVSQSPKRREVPEAFKRRAIQKRLFKHPILLEEELFAIDYPEYKGKLSFLDLDVDVRMMIYKELLLSPKPISLCPTVEETYYSADVRPVNHYPYKFLGGHKLYVQEIAPLLRLLRTCKTINREASQVFYGNNTFDFTTPAGWVVLFCFLAKIGAANRKHIRYISLPAPWCSQMECIRCVNQKYMVGLIKGQVVIEALPYAQQARHNEYLNAQLTHLFQRAEGIMSRAIMRSCIWLHTCQNLARLELVMKSDWALPNRLVVREDEKWKFRKALTPRNGCWFSKDLTHVDLWGLMHGLQVKNQEDQTRHDMKIQLTLVSGPPPRQYQTYWAWRWREREHERKHSNIMAQGRVLGWETGTCELSGFAQRNKS